MPGSKRLERALPMSFDGVAITVEGVSKRFEIYAHPRDQLKQFVLPRIQRRVGMKTKQYFREFWALKDISFEIKKGETVGIIGLNGSGKSTLLQILCATLTPTRGMVGINGRVAALLELGAGFNPEFTGRENVYMNARVLGLSEGDIDARFNDIVAFADIGDFIDQPVKVYSSGMYVRLAFAVIAHVNADILIIDEALAVGDALFTQKCMSFLRSFMKNGTVLFVSHDIASVKNLCTRVLWLEKGQVLKNGNPKDVCDLYYQHTLQGIYGDEVKLDTISNSILNNVIVQESLSPETVLAIDYESKIFIQDNSAMATGWQTGAAEVISTYMEHLDNKSNNVFEGGDKVRLNMRAKAYSALANPILGFIVKDRLGQELFGENTIPFTQGKQFSVMAGQELKAEFTFRLPILQDGQYVVMTSIANGDSYNHVQHHYVHDALIINVYSSKIRFGIVGVPFESVSLVISDQIS
jgi:lipopolysaccharide transport system ATP-binding protein